MGVIRAKRLITDADIPAEIARDTETTAAIATHAALADPHPVYLTQAEGDARYLPLLFKEITFKSGSTEGSLVSMAHGLDASKIMGFSALLRTSVQGLTMLIPPGVLSSPAGCYYDVYLGTDFTWIRNHPTNSENALFKPVTVSFFYKP